MSSSENHNLPLVQGGEMPVAPLRNGFLFWLGLFCLYLSLALPLFLVLPWLVFGEALGKHGPSPVVQAFGQSLIFSWLAYLGRKGAIGPNSSPQNGKAKQNSSAFVHPVSPVVRRKMKESGWYGLAGVLCILGFLAHLRTGHPSLPELAFWELLTPTGALLSLWLMERAEGKPLHRPVATIPSTVTPQAAALTGNADAVPAVTTPVPAVEEQPAVVAVRRSG